jgi:hypothetical protein
MSAYGIELLVLNSVTTQAVYVNVKDIIPSYPFTGSAGLHLCDEL